MSFYLPDAYATWPVEEQRDYLRARLERMGATVDRSEQERLRMAERLQTLERLVIESARLVGDPERVR